jgi:glycine/D-amino acid oxidase-like deaminating enzyme
MAWFAHREDGWEAASERTLAALEIPVDRLDVASAAKLYPRFRGDDLAFVLLEPEGGVLRAERSMKTLAAQAVSHGAQIVRGRARPEGEAVVLEDSTRLEADVVVWACGPWLPKLFPELVSLRVTSRSCYSWTVDRRGDRPGFPPGATTSCPDTEPPTSMI